MVGQTAPHKKGRGKVTGTYPGIYAAFNNAEKKNKNSEGRAAPAQSSSKTGESNIPDRLDSPRFKKFFTAEKERLDSLTSSECNRVCVGCGATEHLPSECFGRDSDTTKLHACRGRYCPKSTEKDSKCKCGGHFGKASSQHK